MTPDQLALLRSNFAAVAMNPDGFTRAFYDRLFDTAPSVKGLFPADLALQRQRLAHELGVIVDAASDPARLAPRLRRLGARHVQYGAEPGHYSVVASVLLETLAAALGDAFNDDARVAWTEALTSVANAMLEGAESATDTSAPSATSATSAA